MNARVSRAACTILLAALLPLSACSSDSGGSGQPVNTGGELVVLSTVPADNGRLFLNQPIRFVMSNPVDLSSANLNSVTFSVFSTATGTPVDEPVLGEFKYGFEAGVENPRFLEFVPRLPTTDTYSDGGFRPGRRYIVQLNASQGSGAPVLQDTNGRRMRAGRSFSFVTPVGTIARDLFLDEKPGGPRLVTPVEITPKLSDGRVPLNLFGRVPVEVRLTFNQALNPALSNVPRDQSLDPVLRASRNKGRVFLEYVDPILGPRVWIPAAPTLERNTVGLSELVLRPDGVLPNNATVSVIVEATLEDISGESNSGDPAYDREIARFSTAVAYESQFSAAGDEFDDYRFIDRGAPFLEPQAEVDGGALKASFNFQGTVGTLDYEPVDKNVVLNTEFTTVFTKGISGGITVSGGIFQFRNITIPEGFTVSGVGANPLVFLATGDVRISGTLSVNGGNGQKAINDNAANLPTAGGVGHAGGGNGGQGSPDTQLTSQRGENGFGPGGIRDGGGEAGTLGCGTPRRGSAGGGGSFATQGDPTFTPLQNPAHQQVGVGGNGQLNAATANLPGGLAGPRSFFTDGKDENEFFGSVLFRGQNRKIIGELTAPVGGSGGGGGGDRTVDLACDSKNFVNDDRGGGGGGGGGVVIIRSLGTIHITRTGKVTANGGHGGGGENNAGNQFAGGGGGGSGGMVILESSVEIRLSRHAETYLNGDSNFALSADGGIGLQDGIGAVTAKYPAPANFNTWNGLGIGGFGGMGVVQLMAPPGSNADNTATVLDDNIFLYDADDTTRLTDPALKRRYLGWRGLGARDVNGNGLADDGTTRVTDRAGDIRPEPVLLPVTYGRYSRARSRWIYTGATSRRELVAPDGQPRGMVKDTVNNLLAGPAYLFDGTNTAGALAGYVEYDISGQQIVTPLEFGGRRDLPVTAVQSLGAQVGGAQAHLLELGGLFLGTVPNTYSYYRAQVFDVAMASLGEFRIVGNTASQLYLDPADGAVGPEIRFVRVLPKFFQVRTNGVAGLGPVYIPNISQPDVKAPIANTRIGFAFHKDPADPNGTRYPTAINTFVYDLEAPGVREDIRALHLEYVQFDVLFNLDFNPADPNLPGQSPVSPDSPRPWIDFLLIPYRF